MNRLVIKTERLVLRDFTQTDLTAYQAVCSHPAFRQFYSAGEATPERYAQLLDTFIGWAAEQPRTKFQMAIELYTGTLIGSCGVRITSTVEKQATFGCELNQSYWGKGFAQEASRAILNFGFVELDLNKIYAETNSSNLAAVALARKLGFQIEPETEENRPLREQRQNTTVLSILKSDRR